MTTGTVSVIGGLVIGRYVVPDNGSNGSDTASVAPQTSPSDTPPGVTPTLAPSPKPSSQPADTATPTSVPGVPTRINEFGIPVGYPRTEAGAVSACANYVSAYVKATNREPTRLKQIFRSIADPSTANRLSQLLIDVNNQTAKNFGVASVNSPDFQLIYRTLGYKVEKFNPNETKVYIWSNASAGIIGGSPNYKPRNFWGTDLCTVSWSGTDWKLSDATDGPDG
ncbi:hypothetical protein, partial [Frankia sp. CcWB2]